MTQEDEAFRGGVSLNAAKARRVLMQTGHLLDALQNSMKYMMSECRKHQRFILSNEEVGQGFAWQLRMDDINAKRAGKLRANDLLERQPKTAAYWALLMIEVNWDYHLKGKRFMFKEMNRDKLMQAGVTLQEALEKLAMMNRSDRLQAAPGGRQPGPPVPHNYPPQQSWPDEPIVVWLSPVWDRERKSAAAAASGGDGGRSVRPRHDQPAEQQWSHTWSHAAWQDQPGRGWRWAPAAEPSRSSKWQGQCQD